MFVPIKGQRLSDHAVNQLMDLMRSGRIQPDEKLPTEQELATQLGVSRTAIREALRVLETLGHVESKRGHGTFVRSPGSRTEQFSAHWHEWVRTYSKDLVDLYQVRQAIETQTAALAAHRAIPAEVAALHHCVDEMVRAATGQNTDRVVSLDVEFHALISAMSRNKLLQRLLAELKGVLDEHRPILLSMRGTTSLKEHRRIVQTIERGDGAAASRAMYKHVAGVLVLVQELTDGKG